MINNTIDILGQIQIQRNKLQDKRYQAVPLREALRDWIATVRDPNTVPADLDANGLLHTLDRALARPELVPLDLLVEYISELIPIMENVGAGHDFRSAIDRAIKYYEFTNQPVISLLLAKVEYLRLSDTESIDKEHALEAAHEAAKKPVEKIQVLLKYIQYYIDISQYRRGEETCQKAIDLINENTEIQSYLAKVYDLLGIIYFYRFKYKIAKHYLEKACQTSKHYGDEHTLGEAMHYLGRIAMDEGDFALAMHNLIAGNQRQPYNLADTAWYHLRLGNLLAKCGLIKEAREHLMISQDLFSKIQYNGSALVQIDLAWAELYKFQRKFKIAETHILKAIKSAQSTHFYRGELLCLVNLFWLQLIHLRRIDKALCTFSRGMANPEIRRNEGIRLIANYLGKVLVIPYMWLRRKNYSLTGTATLNIKIQACDCPIHSSHSSQIDQPHPSL